MQQLTRIQLRLSVLGYQKMRLKCCIIVKIGRFEGDVQKYQLLDESMSFITVQCLTIPVFLNISNHEYKPPFHKLVIIATHNKEEIKHTHNIVTQKMRSQI